MYLPVSFAGTWQLPLMICKAFPDGGYQLLTFFILHSILTVAAGAYSLTSLHLAVLMSLDGCSWILLFILLCQHVLLAEFTY